MKLYLRKISILVALLAVITAVVLLWLSSHYSSAVRADLKQFLLPKLVEIEPPSQPGKVDAIYILGGNQTSLQYKYATAAEVYKKGICKTILILHRAGHTEYIPSLGRNLSNDEWSLRTLNKYGVPAERVKILEVEDGFFGTYQEAKEITSYVAGANYKSLLLVSISSHTRRVKESFEFFSRNHNFKVYTMGSDETVLLREMVSEIIKLKVYQTLLLKRNLS